MHAGPVGSNLFGLIVYFEKVPRAHRKCIIIIRFLPFFFFHLLNYFEIHLRGVTTPIREHCFVFFLLYKTINSHEEMATMSVYQCNVLQDSVSVCFLKKKRKRKCYFQRTCLTFLPFVLYIHSAWTVLQSKQSCFFWIWFLFFTQFTPAVQQQWLSSLPFWQPVSLNN